MVIKIPLETATNSNRFFSNKAVISFETPTSPMQAMAWIRVFNEEQPIKLSLYNELVNSLFVVQFDVLANPYVREILM